MFAISNRELEQFATVVAHDLRAPLRHINQFATFLLSELGQDAKAEVLEYLHIIQSSSVNMTGMIDRLLDYARIGAGAPSFSTVDLKDCVEQAVTLLRSEFAQSGGRIDCAALPRVHGDPLLLVRLFQNLISNALKYRQQNRGVVVGIDSIGDDRAVLVRVTDNGIGINPVHAETIFKMFSRLHSDDEYSGHGLGLSICRRICEIHGGTIELDTTWSDGARFLVRLPTEHGKQKP